MVEIQSKERLKAAIRTTEKPVSFLVGAPISWDGVNGVPPVSGIIALIREFIQHRDPQSSADLEAKMGDGTSPDAYQRAMSFLQASFDPEAVDQVVQSAVLGARRSEAAGFDFPPIGEGRPEDWHIASGVSGMAQLIRDQSDKFTSPILTTNFDPLIGLSLQSVGLRPRACVIPMDGSVAVARRNHVDEIDVVHLHGYWRDSPTLHTPTQLGSQRPQLQQSLQRLLRYRTLVVIAYGGWDDVITTALWNSLNDPQFEGSVRWCFYGDSEAELREQKAELLHKFERGVGSGRIQFYRSVDCHTIFDEILAASGAAPSTIAATRASPLAGWELIDNAQLGALKPFKGAEAGRFFDGAVPTWRHAVSALIPRLSHVGLLGARLEQARADTAASALQLVRAAGGEGKSTALMQVAADAARNTDWSVVWRPSPELGIRPDMIAKLAPDRDWLIVADDAETLIDDIWQCANILHQTGRSNVLFLLASRDTDWRVAGGDRMRWDNRLRRFDDVLLAGVSMCDAALVVEAWATQGQRGLRALAAEADVSARAGALFEAARDHDGRGDGSFLGGLLEIRFDDAGLRAHVRGLLERLREMPVAGGTGTLFDALLYAAACHAVGIPGVDANVLAPLVGAPRDWISSRVVRPLGAEIGAVQSAGHVLTRHRRVASAIIVEAEDRLGIDLAEIWRHLVRETARCGREHLVGRQSHGPILHAGPRLVRDLPDTLSKGRRQAIALAAAEAAYEHQSEWLGYVVDLGRTLRSIGRPRDAARIFRNNLRDSKSKIDFEGFIRGYFHEWSTCEGNIGGRDHQILSALLGCMSLSDRLTAPLSDLKRVKLSCAGLGVTLGKLSIGSNRDDPFPKARRAATQIGWRTYPDSRTAGYFRRYEDELDEADVPRAESLDEEIEWLAAGGFAAYQETTDDFLRRFEYAGPLRFTMLHDLLEQ